MNPWPKYPVIHEIKYESGRRIKERRERRNLKISQPTAIMPVLGRAAGMKTVRSGNTQLSAPVAPHAGKIAA
ncbi:MAG TPA: hypothetical protein VGJ94_00225 [Syntrophorhabdaceae bacterium]|jgi:hypothetical protein